MCKTRKYPPAMGINTSKITESNDPEKNPEGSINGLKSPDAKKTYNQILLIEDNETDIFLAQQVISGMNITNEIVVVRTGLDGLEYLDRHYQSYHKFPELIMVDMQMPGIDGIEFIRRLKSNPHFANENTKVIVLTAGLDSDNERKMLRSIGVEDKHMLLKPIDRSELMRLLS